MAGLTAVLAGVFVDAWLRAVTKTVAFLLTVVALEIGFVLELDLVLRAVLGHVTQLWRVLDDLCNRYDRIKTHSYHYSCGIELQAGP
jgi:hypothetical protein